MYVLVAGRPYVYVEEQQDRGIRFGLGGPEFQFLEISVKEVEQTSFEDTAAVKMKN